MNQNTNQRIETTVKNYLQGYLQAEGPTLMAAFHPETRLFAFIEGKLVKTEMPTWLKNLDERKAQGDVKIADTHMQILDATDNAAVVKVSIHFTQFDYTDYLSLLEIDGKWQVIGKIYTRKEV